MQNHPLDIFTKKYLSDFSPEEPLTWKMHLPFSRFRKLEGLIKQYKDVALSYPVAVIVYLAEWYKWCYSGQGYQGRVICPTSEQLHQLYVDAGIDIERYVAVNLETGRHSWLHSIFVLGGLPLNQEVARKRVSGFLRSICRMYHGGAGEISAEVSDAGRAEAFRKALQSGGPLHGFVKALIDGNKPFASEDVDNPVLPIQQFCNLLIEANKQVRRNKFDIRHLIFCPPGSDVMNRRLALHLLPEITGKGLGQYLMHDRILLWGFPNPKEIEWIEIFVRFKNGEQLLKETKGLATFTNTGLESRGFVGWNLKDKIIVKDVPAQEFDKILIIARDNQGRENVVQECKEQDIIQLYQTENYCEWSDYPNPQRATALIWSSPWQLFGCPSGLDSLRKFVDCNKNLSEKTYHFTFIPDSLSLYDCNDNEVTFYNHQGLDRLEAIGHYDTIAYLPNDEVLFLETDDDENTDESFLPLIYSKNDLKVVRRSCNEEEEVLEIEPEIFEWKSGARYVEWSEDNAPLPGRIKIRTLVRGRYLMREFIFIGGEVKRDIEQNSIVYPGGIFNVGIPDDEAPIYPTIPVEISLEGGVCVLNVWCPYDIKEINIGTRNYLRMASPELYIPAIVCDEAWVGIFDLNGYRRYICAPLTEIYSRSDIDKLGLLNNCTSLPATDLDPLAPNVLNLILATRYNKDTNHAEWIFWDYIGELEKFRDFTSELPNNSILFQDRTREVNPLKIYAPILGRFNSFKYRPISGVINLLDCFETAAYYGQYYFAFLPLRNIDSERFKIEIIERLKEKVGTPLPVKLKSEIERAIKELNLEILDNYEI